MKCRQYSLGISRIFHPQLKYLLSQNAVNVGKLVVALEASPFSICGFQGLNGGLDGAAINK